MIQLGASPSNIFVLGKRYSENEQVVASFIKLGVQYQACSPQMHSGSFDLSFIRDVNWLWARVMEQISSNIDQMIILDHGGHAINYVPPMLVHRYKIIGIEKTSAGFFDIGERGLPPFPVINVANCAAKKYVESPLIAEAIVNKIISYLPVDKHDITCGVVGLGSIGKAVAKKLLSMGYTVVIFDTDEQQLSVFKEGNGFICVHNISELMSISDYIFGCSGRDITASNLEYFQFASKNKTLISCSSEDKEFLSLLRLIQRQREGLFDPLNDIQYTNQLGVSIQILRGGFPVNFDASGESVPAVDIQLTRALVLSAVMQAIGYFNRSDIISQSGIYALEPDEQRFIVHEWIKQKDVLNPIFRKIVEKFTCNQLISNHSALSS
jgi:S-adenosylhomocysteine hydrolase